MSWNETTEWESSWWGGCFNSFGEELKQLVYADRMGLKAYHDGKSPCNFDLKGATVLDIGGGPVSLLLKCTNFIGTVIDPCEYPKWVGERYKTAKINYIKARGEDLDLSVNYDLVLIYNVLQHTEDPQRIIKNALTVSKELRIFEWLYTPIDTGHQHSFTNNQLNGWLWGTGKVEKLNESGCIGTCYYGIFKGNRYGG